MKVLIIEDDARISTPMKIHLEHQRHTVKTASDGASGLALASAEDYDFILLDLMLPQMDGLTVCQSLRDRGCNSAIIMITARDKSVDKIKGLNCGADDYIGKPFELDELTARMQAISRRGREVKSSVLKAGALELDQQSCITTFQSKPVNLTPTEYKLLQHFLNNPRRTYSKDELMERFWSDDVTVNDDIVKTHIKGLRAKLKAAGASGDIIETVYGMGYRLKAHA